MPIIAVANQKGGVGKTTSTLNLGAALQEAGKRVLLIDFDPQGNLSVAAGVVDIDAAYPSIGDLLTLGGRGRTPGAPTIESAIVASPAGLDLVPSNGTLSAAELGLVSSLNRESALSVLLKPIESKYDYILIDCLPSLGLLAINALRAANGIIIPVQADFLAIQGLAQIFETIAAVREQLNPDLNILGVVLTLVDQRTAHSREVVRVVRSSLTGQVNVFETEVRLHVALKETARAGRTILDYDTNSPSASAYRHLASEVLQVCGDPSAQPAERASKSTTSNESLLDLPILVAPVPQADQQVVSRHRANESVVAHSSLADAPKFETFVGEGWQQWLGASS